MRSQCHVVYSGLRRNFCNARDDLRLSFVSLSYAKSVHIIFGVKMSLRLESEGPGGGECWGCAEDGLDRKLALCFSTAFKIDVSEI